MPPVNSTSTTNPVNCRTSPTAIADISAQIMGCSAQEETDKKNSFITNTLYLKQDIVALRANITNSFAMAEQVFGTSGHTTITNQIKDRNTDLENKKNSISQDIKRDESIIERSNRDFIDVKQTLPEKQANKTLHFIEDYTLAVLSVSYLFMICIGIYYFSIRKTREFNTSDFFSALINSGLLTIVVGVVLYYIS